MTKYRLAAVGEQLLQERVHPKQGLKKHDAAVAILDIGGMNDGMEQHAQVQPSRYGELLLRFVLVPGRARTNQPPTL